jgi:hypothetical protein
LPNIEANVDEGDAEIVAFVRRWKGRRVERANISHIDLHHKERRRLDLLESVRDGSGNARS